MDDVKRFSREREAQGPRLFRFTDEDWTLGGCACASCCVAEVDRRRLAQKSVMGIHSNRVPPTRGRGLVGGERSVLGQTSHRERSANEETPRNGAWWQNHATGECSRRSAGSETAIAYRERSHIEGRHFGSSRPPSRHGEGGGSGLGIIGGSCVRESGADRPGMRQECQRLGRSDSPSWGRERPSVQTKSLGLPKRNPVS